jgi:hypothetical protein
MWYRYQSDNVDHRLDSIRVDTCVIGRGKEEYIMWYWSDNVDHGLH